VSFGPPAQKAQLRSTRCQLTDVMTSEQRSRCMSRIRGRNTKPELQVRSCLHRLGYRFRLHDAQLPGHPDIVLPRYRTVVLVHGCFWHRHEGCGYAYVPKSRQAFWETKFKNNTARDRAIEQKLESLGWGVVVIWECQTRNASALTESLRTALPPRVNR